MKQILIYNLDYLQALVSVIAIAIAFSDIFLNGIFSNIYEHLAEKYGYENFFLSLVSCSKCLSIWLMAFYLIPNIFGYGNVILQAYMFFAMLFLPAVIIYLFKEASHG